MLRGKMIIRDFEAKHTEGATEIALGAYNYERAFAQELPEISGIPILKQLSGNGFGVAAFEGEKMVGFLCSVGAFENAFRSTDGGYRGRVFGFCGKGKGALLCSEDRWRIMRLYGSVR